VSVFSTSSLFDVLDLDSISHSPSPLILDIREDINRHSHPCGVKLGYLDLSRDFSSVCEQVLYLTGC
jgi:hypothetical protein